MTHLYQARIYLREARARRHDGKFHATLLDWAAKRRRQYQAEERQLELAL